MASALFSCSTGRFHLVCPVTRCVGYEVNSVAYSSVLLERANCFDERSTNVSVGRSRRRRVCPRTVLVRAGRQGNGDEKGDGVDNVDISVFRFTLGIPGFDDSELPRVVGILFGGLIILNHAVSLNSGTPALVRSEAIGLFLAAVSISLPAINRQLNGGISSSRWKPGQKQLFALADRLSDIQRKELAWSSYTLLRNTDSTACLIWYASKVVCARGFWEIPSVDGPDAKSSDLVWLEKKLESRCFAQLEAPLYISSNADRGELEVIPEGTASLLFQPFPWFGGSGSPGFLLVISNIPQAYRKKDKIWIASIANKLSEVLPW